MLVRDYLELKGYKGNITFIKARARKDAHTPYYHYEYQTTPIINVDELYDRDSKLLDYIVLNDKQSPIDWLTNTGWTNWYNRGQLKSMLVVTKEDLQLVYRNPQQLESMIKRIDNELTKG